MLFIENPQIVRTCRRTSPGLSATPFAVPLQTCPPPGVRGNFKTTLNYLGAFMQSMTFWTASTPSRTTGLPQITKNEFTRPAAFGLKW